MVRKGLNGDLTMASKSLSYHIAIAAASLAASFIVPGVASVAQTPAIVALDALQPGQWELREAGGGAVRSLCLGDARLLLQLRHGAAQCSRYVITNDSKVATVTYSCAGNGNGRTTVRVETPRLVQIDTQGVADKSPFVMRLEGRRVGVCTAPGRSVSPQARRLEKAQRLGIR
jgi:hypothetical protein